MSIQSKADIQRIDSAKVRPKSELFLNIRHITCRIESLFLCLVFWKCFKIQYVQVLCWTNCMLVSVNYLSFYRLLVYFDTRWNMQRLMIYTVQSNRFCSCCFCFWVVAERDENCLKWDFCCLTNSINNWNKFWPILLHWWNCLSGLFEVSQNDHSNDMCVFLKTFRIHCQPSLLLYVVQCKIFLKIVRYENIRMETIGDRNFIDSFISHHFVSMWSRIHLLFVCYTAHWDRRDVPHNKTQ